MKKNSIPQKRLSLTSMFLILVILIGIFAISGEGSVLGIGATTDNIVYISSEEDFLNQSFNSGKGTKYIFTTDIYLDRYYAADASANAIKFSSFEGEIDGRGHAIVGYRNKATSSAVALFDTIQSGARVANLNVIDAEITTGDGNEAAIVAVKNLGTIDNVKVSGKVSAGRAAGIAVFNFGTISNSVSMAECESKWQVPEDSLIDLTGVTSGAAIAVSNSDRFDSESLIPASYVCSDTYNTAIFGSSSLFGVSYDQCNPFGMVAGKFGPIADIGKSTEQTAGSETVASFNALSAYFNAFIDNFSVPAGATSYYSPALTGTDSAAYNSFFDAANELYGGSRAQFTRDVMRNFAWWCYDSYQATVTGDAGNNINVVYDECNPFGMIAGHFGDISDIENNVTDSVSQSIITAFNALGIAFGEFMDNLIVPTDGTEYNAVIADGWCSELYSKKLAGYDGNTVTVRYDECNPFGMIAGHFGSIADIGKNTSKTATTATVNAFAAMAASYNAFAGELNLTNVSYPVNLASGTENYTRYTQFFNKAIALYNKSYAPFSKNFGYNTAPSVLVGANDDRIFTFGGAQLTGVDVKAAVAKLFGYASVTDFVTDADNLATAYGAYRTRIDSPLAGDEALDNGAFYADGTFIFPMAIYNGVTPAVLLMVIIDGNNDVTIWLHNLEYALRAVDYNADYHTSAPLTNLIYCKNSLFVNNTAVTSKVYSDYSDFYSKAIALFDSSYITSVHGASSAATYSAVVGINHPFYVSMGGSLNGEVDAREVVAKLFGYTSVDDMADDAVSLANLYSAYRTRRDSPLSSDAALENGCFLSGGTFIFPIAIKNRLSSKLLAFVIIDEENRVSVWLNDIRAAMYAVSYSSAYHTEGDVENLIYCKNTLFARVPVTSAVIGLNNKLALRLGADAGNENIDFELVAARLFGFADKSEFLGYVSDLADLYSGYRTRIGSALPADGALENGAFYTTDGSFVFPIAIRNAVALVLTYVIITPDDDVYLWINNLKSALTAVDYSSAYHSEKSITNELICKNILFVTGPELLGGRYTPAYSIADCYGPTGMSCVADGSANHLRYNSGSGFEDGVGDYVTLKLYADRYAAAANGSKPEVAQNSYINMYNSELTDSEIAVLNAAYLGGSYVKSNFDFFNNSGMTLEVMRSSVDYSAIGKAAGVASDSITCVGEGDSAYYPIASVGDLIKAHEYDGVGVKFVLTENISLHASASAGYYPASGCIFDSFSGIFEGNGKVISGLAGALFGTIGEGATVRGLNVFGRGEEGLLALTSNGTVSDIYARGVGLLVGHNDGIINNSTVDTTYGVAYNTSSGSVNYTRNYRGDFLKQEEASSENASSVTDSLNYAGAWNARTLARCVNIDALGNVSVSEDTDITSLTTPKAADYITRAGDNGSGGAVTFVTPAYSTGWKFASDLGWAFLSGSTEDIPVLVFPADRVAYKGITVVKPARSSYAYSIGRNARSGSASVTGCLRSSTEFITLPAYNGNDEIRYDSGIYYLGLSSAVDMLRRSDFEFILSGMVYEDLLDLIDGTEGSEYLWYKLVGGKEVALTGSGEFLSDGTGTYRVRMLHRYLWITATIELSGGEPYTADFDYSIVQYGIQDIYAYGDLNLASLVSQFDALGLERIDDINPLGYQGMSATWALGGAVYGGNILCDIGTYTLTVTVPATEYSTSYELAFTYKIAEGNMDLDEYELISSIGGLTEGEAITYNGSQITVGADTFTLLNFEHYGMSYGGCSIISYRRADGTQEIASSILNAGYYELEITVNIPGYTPVKRRFQFFIARKEVVVTPRIDTSVSYVYYDEHPTVSYTSAEFGENTALRFTGLAYTSSYVKGAHAGNDYTIAVSVSDACRASDRNYIPVAGGAISFRLNPAELDISGVDFTNAEYVYDGKAHSVSVNKGAIRFRDAPSKYAVTVTYGYGAELSTDVPFAFIGIGRYTGLSAKIAVDSSDYVSPVTIADRTLEIKPLGVTLEARDISVKYGDAAVYELIAYRTDGGEEVEDYLTKLTAGVHYSMSSDYVVNVTTAGSTLPITLELPAGSAVGNYLLSVSSRTAHLTIGKRSYSVSMEDEYVYGTDYTTAFKHLPLDSGYPKYYVISIGNTESAFSGERPTEANQGKNYYRVKLKVSESEEYYEYTAQFDFIITQKATNFSGLYLYHNGNKRILGDNFSYKYDGKDYIIDLDWDECSAGANYVKSYRYRLYSATGEEYYYSSDKAIAIKDATRIKDITVILTSDNYTAWSSVENGRQRITSFEIKPSVISFVGSTAESAIAEAPFKDQVYTNSNIADVVNGLQVTGLYEGDTVTFTVDAGGKSIRVPDSYDVIVGRNNKNYVFDTAKPYVIDNGERLNMTFKVVAAEVELDLSDVEYTYNYGEIYRVNQNENPQFSVNFEYVLNDIARTTAITFVVDTTELVPAPYVYAVTAALPLKSNGVEAVRFRIKGGADTLKIVPKEVSLDWSKVCSYGGSDYGFKSSYVYSGSTIYMPEKFNKSYVGGTVRNNDPDIRISYSLPLKHVGDYTLTATTGVIKTAPDGKAVECYIIPAIQRTFNLSVTRRTVKYTLGPRSIFVGLTCPDFDITYAEGFAPYAGDSLRITFTADGYVGKTGKYSVTADIKVADGGLDYADYRAVKVDGDAKELTVTDRKLPDDIACPDAEFTYTGEAFTPEVTNLPDEITVTVKYSERPVNRGVYNITVTVSAEGYSDTILKTKVTVNAATVDISMGKRSAVKYDSSYELSSSDIIGSATFKGEEVEGTFRFTQRVPQQTLAYGKHTYSVEFVPVSPNFRTVRNIEYTFESYVILDEVVVAGVSGDDRDDISSAVEKVIEVSANKEYRVSVELPEHLAGAAVLYVNGESVLNGSYTFTESATDVLVEVRLGGAVLMSKRLNVTITGAAPSKPTEPDEGTAPGGNGGNSNGGSGSGSGNSGGSTSGGPGGVSASISEEGKRILIIVGSSVGGALVLGGAIAVTIVVVKKKKKS